MLSVTLYTTYMDIIGHRGARGLAPENTLKSIEKCLEYQPLGATMVEFDVRVTRDNVPILLHDRHLTDASGNKLDVREHSFEELQKHKPDLATLDAALTLIDGRLIPYIEIKRGEVVEPIARVIRSHLGKTYASDGLRLASKSQKTLRAVHQELPEIPTIVIEPWSGVLATRRARQLGTTNLSMKALWLWPGFIRAMSRRGYTLYAYTLNDAKKARRWQKSGLAGVVTDYPDIYASK
jgi:glycerophosphoryl diester phosphodiesterase